MPTKDLKRLSAEQVAEQFTDPWLVQAITCGVNVAEALHTEIVGLEKTILEQARQCPEYALLESIPGIGKTLAMTILYETGSLSRFADAGHFCSYCRCVPSRHLSNGKVKGKGNTRNGNPYLSWAFIEAAHFAIRFEPLAKKYYERKKARSCPLVALRAVAHKMARACFYVMRDQVPFQSSPAASSPEIQIVDTPESPETTGNAANFRLFQSASLSYQRSRYEDRYNVLLADDTIVTLPAFIDNSSLRPMYVFDSRDNPFLPNRGRRLSLGVEYAGGFLGGDNQFLRPEATFSIFQPVNGSTVRSMLAFNAKGGWIDAFGSHDIPSLERYFLGGENSIRGHERHSIYLRDAGGNPRRDANGAILGGDSFVHLNLEYQFLLGGPFRLLLFADAGNVFGEGQPFDLADLRTTAGLELRVLLPVFGAPLRFIYATNLDPRPQDDFEKFKFNVGTSF